MRRLLGGIGVACLGVGGYAYMGYSVDAYAYTHPLLKKLLDPEDLHRLAVLVAAQPRILRSFLGLVDSRPDDSILKTNAFGMEFSNPIGLAAGFDKHAECMEGIVTLVLSDADVID